MRFICLYEPADEIFKYMNVLLNASAAVTV